MRPRRPGRSTRTYVHSSYEGDNTSPHLRWSGFPDDTQSFAVTCFDPDAPTGSGFWHWVLFDIPASVTELARGASPDGLPEGAVEHATTMASSATAARHRPAATARHRYVFTVHALGTESLRDRLERVAGVRRLQPLRERARARGDPPDVDRPRLTPALSNFPGFVTTMSP